MYTLEYKYTLEYNVLSLSLKKTGSFMNHPRAKPKIDDVEVHVRMPEELRNWLDENARKNGRSRAAELVMLVMDHRRREKKRKKRSNVIRLFKNIQAENH